MWAAVTVLPRSSSPAVSLEGATLMHRLVNLRTKKRRVKERPGKKKHLSVDKTFIFKLQLILADCQGYNIYSRLRDRQSRDLYLMGSLVALSLTVEENEECVFSSNRNDRGGFTESKKHRGVTQTEAGIVTNVLSCVQHCIHLQACVYLSAGTCWEW